jgi:hypothetical protein
VASRIVTQLFAEGGKGLYLTIKAGKPLPTIVGAVAGAGLGATLGFCDLTLLAFGTLLGAILGAAALAAKFPRPTLEPGTSADNSERASSNADGTSVE